MGKYRKKPVEIEAIQYDGIFDLFDMPDWIKEAHEKEIVFLDNDGELFIATLEGVMKVEGDDYIIQGVKGELYPCKPDIFELTYDKVNEIQKQNVNYSITATTNIDELKELTEVLEEIVRKINNYKFNVSINK